MVTVESIASLRNEDGDKLEKRTEKKQLISSPGELNSVRATPFFARPLCRLLHDYGLTFQF